MLSASKALVFLLLDCTTQAAATGFLATEAAAASSSEPLHPLHPTDEPLPTEPPSPTGSTAPSDALFEFEDPDADFLKEALLDPPETADDARARRQKELAQMQPRFCRVVSKISGEVFIKSIQVPGSMTVRQMKQEIAATVNITAAAGRTVHRSAERMRLFIDRSPVVRSTLGQLSRPWSTLPIKQPSLVSIVGQFCGTELTNDDEYFGDMITRGDGGVSDVLEVLFVVPSYSIVLTSVEPEEFLAEKWQEALEKMMKDLSRKWVVDDLCKEENFDRSDNVSMPRVTLRTYTDSMVRQQRGAGQARG